MTTTREYYWLDGSAYCPDCVECDTPAIDASNPHVQRGMAVRCSCCGAEGERQYRIALADSNGEWDVLEWFSAADHDAANAYAEEHYADHEWYVLDHTGRNINGGVDG